MEMIAARPLVELLGGWSGPTSLRSVATNKTWRGNVLVTLFLRGGADGVSVLVPHADDHYHRQRPTLSLGTPKRGGVVDLDGFYGLHPALAPLLPLYRSGQLAGIHAIGSQDRSRSHFEAMATMERGAAADPQSIPSGWLARAVAGSSTQNPSPLRAVAFGPVFPDILRGAAGAVQLDDLSQLRLRGNARHREGLRQRYSRESGPLGQHGRETFQVVDALDRISPTSSRTANGAVYPQSPLGRGFQQAALLIKADVGAQAIALDRHGFDTHFGQGVATGLLANQLDDVAKALAAFAKDLGPELKRTTVLVMTEFGRRVPENSQLGTDHGRAGAWLVLGNQVRGGKVHGKWPGLAPDQLEGPGDLKVTTDYRSVLADAVSRLWPGTDVARLFSGLSPKRTGIFV
jgi:uncharacterized protein (DUF1501 family)